MPGPLILRREHLDAIGPLIPAELFRIPPSAIFGRAGAYRQQAPKSGVQRYIRTSRESPRCPITMTARSFGQVDRVYVLNRL